MKAILAALVLAVSVSASAQEAPADMTLGGLPALVGEKLKEVKPAGMATTSGKVGGGAYLPIWALKGRSGTRYAELLNVGYRGLAGEKPDVLFMPVALNLPALSARLWDFEWARVHLERSKFPAVFVGPALFLTPDRKELERLRLDRWQEWTGIVGSVRF